jgi:hypothetical protein
VKRCWSAEEFAEATLTFLNLWQLEKVGGPAQK